MKKNTKKESEAIRNARIEHCGGVCEYCHQKQCTDFHHIFGRRKSEYFETVVMWCHECHTCGNYQKRVEEQKIVCSAELIEKHGEAEARKRAGGRLYFKQESKINNQHSRNTPQ